MRSTFGRGTERMTLSEWRVQGSIKLGKKQTGERGCSEAGVSGRTQTLLKRPEGKGS